MKTISTLMLATLALASLSADHTVDAVGVHSHLTPSQLASIKQRIAESRDKTVHAKVHVPVHKAAAHKPIAPSMVKALAKKDVFEAIGFDQGSGIHLMGSGDDSNSGSDDGSHIDQASNSGDGSGVSLSHGGVETTNFYGTGFDSNSGSSEDSSSGSGESDGQAYELSDLYTAESNDGSSLSSNDGSGSDGSGVDGSGTDGSGTDGSGVAQYDSPAATAMPAEVPIGGTQAIDDDDEGNGNGEGNGEGNGDGNGVESRLKKKLPVAKEHEKGEAKKEVANHEVKKEAVKHEAKTHDKKHDAKKHDAKKHDAKKNADKKKDAAAHKKLSGDKKGDLRKGKAAKVEQKYADNALEEEAQKAGEAIVARLSADSSPFGVKGSEMLVMVGSIAGAVVGVMGVLFAVVHMRRQRNDANTNQHALVSELAEPESGRPAEATVDALTSSGIELDDDEFSDSDDNDAHHEEEGSFANSAAHVV